MIDSNFNPTPTTFKALLAALRQLLCLGATEQASALVSDYVSSRSNNERGRNAIMGRIRSAGFRHWGPHLITEGDFQLRLTRGIDPLEGSTGPIGRSVRTRSGIEGTIADIRGDHARVVGKSYAYSWVPVSDLILS